MTDLFTGLGDDLTDPDGSVVVCIDFDGNVVGANPLGTKLLASARLAQRGVAENGSLREERGPEDCGSSVGVSEAPEGDRTAGDAGVLSAPASDTPASDTPASDTPASDVAASDVAVSAAPLWWVHPYDRELLVEWRDTVGTGGQWEGFARVFHRGGWLGVPLRVTRGESARTLELFIAPLVDLEAPETFALGDIDQPRYRFLVEHAPVGMFEVNQEGYLTYINPRLCDMVTRMGTRVEVGQMWSDLFDPRDIRSLMDHSAEVLVNRRRGFTTRVRLAHSGAGDLVADVAIAVDYDAAGVARGYIGTLNDITDLHLAHEAVVRSETRWRTISETAPIGIVYIDLMGTIGYANPMFEELVGGPAVGRILVDFYHRDDRAAILAERADIPVGGDFLRHVRLARPDGGTRRVVVTGRRLPASADTPSGGYLVMVVDVTEHHRTQAGLDAVTQRLRELIGAMNQGVSVEDERGVVLLVNRAMLAQIGPDSRPDDVVGRRPDSSMPTDMAVVRSRLYSQMRATRQAVRSVEAFRGRILELDCIPLYTDEDYRGCLWLSEDVTEREADAQASQTARERAEALSRAKSEFVAVVSHELRTPLYAILSLSELLLGSTLSEGDRRRMVALNDSARSLGVLIDDILDYSKMESGQLQLSNAPFYLRELAYAQVALVRDDADAKYLDLSCEVDPDVSDVVTGDARRVAQVLSNLLTNAVKYTEVGWVSLRVGRSEGGVAFTVSDSGIGMDPGQLEALRQPFTQGESGASRRWSGVGLGLSICDRLVEMMGGHLSVVSAPGRGSEFSFCVPLEPSAATPGTSGSLLRRRAFEVPAGPADGTRDLNGRGKRVLVVEDNDLNREITCIQLAELGYDTASVERGADALELLERESFDVVLLDKMLPGLDGFEVARRIRERERGGDRRTTLVALTAAAMESDRRDSADAGLDGHVTKPVTITALGEALAEILAKTRP